MSESPPSSPAALPRRLGLPHFAARVTYILLAVNVIVYLADLLSGNFLTMLGALVPALVTDYGQSWRVVTAGFLHGGITHIAMNLYALYGLGRLMERFYGPWRFAAVYLLSLTGASILVTLLSDPARAMVGASGAIMGVTGALLIYFWRYRQLLVGARGFLPRLGRMALINVAVGLLPGISWWGHLGGLLAGIGVGAVLLPKYVHADWTADHLEMQTLDASNQVGLAAIVVGEAVLLTVWALT